MRTAAQGDILELQHAADCNLSREATHEPVAGRHAPCITGFTLEQEWPDQLNYGACNTAEMPVSAYNPPADNGLDVIYLDDTLIVLNKPSGLLSVPGRGAGKQDCLLTRVRDRYPEAECVHRLDMETSGLMLIARGKVAQRQLNTLFESRRVGKKYVAVVDGRLSPGVGIIDLPLICDWPNRPRQKVDFELGKPSKTGFSVLQYDPQAQSSRVELTPETGRSHQLRVHMQSLGHSILGDPLYASGSVCNKATRLLLHATELAFPHPCSARAQHFACAAPF